MCSPNKILLLFGNEPAAYHAVLPHLGGTTITLSPIHHDGTLSIRSQLHAGRASLATRLIAIPDPTDDPLAVLRHLHEPCCVITVVDPDTLFNDCLGINADLAERSFAQLEIAHAFALTTPPSPDVTQFLHAINPLAILLQAPYSLPHDVEPQLAIHPRWLQLLLGDSPPQPDAFCYRAHKPFHPERLLACLSKPWHNVWRSRGFIWLATRMARSAVWSQCGPSHRISPGNRWWAERDPATWPDDRRTLIESRWHEPYGDRRQEIAFIGTSMNVASLTQMLDACLLTDDEMDYGQLGWRYLLDPFVEMRWHHIAR